MKKQELSRSPSKLVILYIIITLIILFTGLRYYYVQKEEIKNDAFTDLSVIAEMKVNQIINWRNERLGDANVILNDKNEINYLISYIKNPKDENLKKNISSHYSSYYNFYHYKDVIIFDTSGKILLSYNEKLNTLGDTAYRNFDYAKKNLNINFGKMYYCEKCNEIHLDISIPLLDKSNLVGGIILRMDPGEFLFPLIQTWPTTSPTSETLLISKEGDEVVFLNELRHKKNTALKLRFKIDSSNYNIPAVQAVLGKEKLVEGIDYRGVPVFSDTRKIPNSDWFMVAKVDKEEIYEPLHNKAITIGILSGLTLITFALGFIWVWSNQKKSMRIQYLEEERKRKALEKHFEYLVKYANDIFILLNKDYNVVDANDRACKTYGYSKEEFVKLNVKDLRLPKTMPQFYEKIRIVNDFGETIFEAEHIRKDGTMFPIEVSLRVVEIGENKFYQGIIRDISERKKVEAELKESELKFRSLFENAVLGIYRTTPEGEIVDCNPALLKMLGFRNLEELAKRNLEINGFEPGYSREEFKKRIKQKGELEKLESAWIKKDGSAIYVSENAKAVKDENGKIVFYEGTVEDITLRKKIELDLITSEKKYRRLHETMIDGFVLINMDGYIMDCNESYMSMLGYNFEELKKITYKDITPEKWNKEENDIVIEQILAKGYSDVYEKEYIRKDGTIFPVEIRAFLLKNESGENEGIWGLVRDITERKRAEEEIKASEEKFSKMFHSSPYAVSLTRLKDGKIIEVNKSFENITGFRFDDVMVKNMIELNIWNDIEDRNYVVNELTKGNKVNGKEFKFVKKSGEVSTGLYSAEIISINDENLILSSFTDISELKKAEEKIKHLVERYHNILSKQFYGTLVVSNENKVEFINDKFCEFFDLKEKPEELIGMGGEEIISRILPMYKDKEYTLNLIKKFVSENKVQTDYEVMLKNGKTLLVDYNPILLDGKSTGRIWQHRDITDRKRMEQELRNSYELLDGMGDIGKIGGWEFDPVTLKGSWTKQVALIHDMDPKDETNAEKGISFYIDESRTKIEKAIKEALENGTPYDLELEMITAKGNHKWVRTIGLADKVEGKVVRVHGSFQDITEKKKSEEILNELSSRNEAILSSVPDIIMEVDINKVYTWSNRAGMEFFGDDVIGKEASYYFEGEQETYNIVQPLFVGKEENILYVESWQRRKDGGKRLLAWWCRSLKDDNGVVTGTLSAAQDITEQKKAEEALRESEAHLHQALQATKGGAWEWDLQTNENYWSEELWEVYGLEPHSCEPSYDSWLQTIHPEDREIAAKAVVESAQNSKELKTEWRVMDKDGSIRWLMSRGQPYFDSTGKAVRYIGTVIDITELKRAEEELRQNGMLLTEMGRIAKIGGWELDVETMTQKWTDETYSIHDRDRGIYNPNANEELSKFESWSKDLMEKVFKDAIERGIPYDIEAEMTTIKGNTKWIRAVCLPLMKNGKVIKLRGTIQDITEKKKVEDALKESQKEKLFFAGLVENSSQPVAVGYTDGRLGIFNKAFLNLIGYDSEEMKKIDWVKDLTPPEWLDSENEKLEELLNTNRPVRYEKEYIRKDGVRIPIELFVHLVRDENNNPEFYYAFVSDITERKKAEAELRESEEKYRTLIELSTDAVFINQENRIIYLNPAAIKLFGAENEEQVLGKSPLNFFHPDYHELIKNRIHKMLDLSETVKTTEEKIIQLKGKIVDVEVAAGPISYGGTPAVQVILRDISERKIAENLLKESENKFRTLFESMDEGVALHELFFDESGKAIDYKIIDANPAFQKHTGLQIEKARNKLASVFYGVKTPPPYFEIYSNVALTGISDYFESYFQPLDRYFEISVFSPKKNFFATVFNDVTERKLADIALRESESKLREAQTIAKLGYWEWDVKSGDVVWSDEVYKIFRLDPAKFIPQIDSILAFSPWPEYHNRGNEIFEDILKGNTSGSYEQKFLRPDNTIGYYFSSYKGKFDEKGELISIVGTVMDITERKKADEEIKKLNEELEQKVQERTKELEDKNYELSRMNKLFVGRELRMVELKEKIKELEEKLK